MQRAIWSMHAYVCGMIWCELLLSSLCDKWDSCVAGPGSGLAACMFSWKNFVPKRQHLILLIYAGSQFGNYCFGELTSCRFDTKRNSRFASDMSQVVVDLADGRRLFIFRSISCVERLHISHAPGTRQPVAAAFVVHFYVSREQVSRKWVNCT